MGSSQIRHYIRKNQSLKSSLVGKQLANDGLEPRVADEPIPVEPGRFRSCWIRRHAGHDNDRLLDRCTVEMIKLWHHRFGDDT